MTSLSPFHPWPPHLDSPHPGLVHPSLFFIEKKVWSRLRELKAQKKKRAKSKPMVVGVLGCMAERLKTRLMEEESLVDLVAGPDAYRDLPHLLAQVRPGGSRT